MPGLMIVLAPVALVLLWGVATFNRFVSLRQQDAGSIQTCCLSSWLSQKTGDLLSPVIDLACNMWNCSPSCPHSMSWGAWYISSMARPIFCNSSS